MFQKDSAAVKGSEDALEVVGRTLLDEGRTRDGFLWLHALARLLPASANAMTSVGLANQRMGDTTRARIWYAQAIAADSLNSRAAARIGLLDSPRPRK
jgi:Flp pilus assembly protein TadD